MTRSLFILFIAIAALVGCGGAGTKSVNLTNKTARSIESIFIFTPGKDRGASRARLAPNESKTLQLPAGNHEIYAVSEKIVHEDKTRETPEASQTIELRDAIDVVFYDSNNVPPGIEAMNVRGIMFRIVPPKKTDEGDAPVDGEGPAVEAPAPPSVDL